MEFHNRKRRYETKEKRPKNHRDYYYIMFDNEVDR